MTNYEQAYSFIYEYKNKHGNNYSQLNESQWNSIKLLSLDLLNLHLSQNIDEINLPALLVQICEVDTKWNHLLQQSLNDFYTKLEQGSKQEAINILKSFLKMCPSTWYRGHAEVALENLN